MHPFFFLPSMKIDGKTFRVFLRVARMGQAVVVAVLLLSFFPLLSFPGKVEEKGIGILSSFSLVLCTTEDATVTRFLLPLFSLSRAE